MNAENVTELHTSAKHKTNRNDLMHFDCIIACSSHVEENDSDGLQA